MELILRGTLIITIILMVIVYTIAKRFPVSSMMQTLTWLLILPSCILPPVLIVGRILNLGRGVNTFLYVTSFAAFCIAIGAALALRLRKVNDRYLLAGVLGAIISPFYGFLMILFGFLVFGV